MPGWMSVYGYETIFFTAATAVVHAAHRRVRALPAAEDGGHRGRELLGRRPAVAHRHDGDHATTACARWLDTRAASSRCCRASTSTATAASARRTRGAASSARRYEIGVGNIMWGNDFPHPEGTWPYTREFLQGPLLGHPDRRDRADPRAQRGRRSTASTSTSSRRSPTASARRPKSSARPTRRCSPSGTTSRRRAARGSPMKRPSRSRSVDAGDGARRTTTCGSGRVDHRRRRRHRPGVRRLARARRRGGGDHGPHRGRRCSTRSARSTRSPATTRRWTSSSVTRSTRPSCVTRSSGRRRMADRLAIAV